MFGKRLEVLEEGIGLEDGRLVKNVVNKLKYDGGFSWWEKYEVLRRK